jgi:2-amino-4-hydroxy-6-hydroxymethyldihydropteridine diphosphokinase
METAYIALGANTGDRRANIAAALEALRATQGIELVRVSSLLENPAVGGPVGSPDFLNAAAEIRTTLQPHALLERLLEIERTLGRRRRRGQKWEPRPIDLDLLLFGQQIIDADNLKIPHPLMHERDFVLRPLSQIAPQVLHPRLQRTIEQLLNPR